MDDDYKRIMIDGNWFTLGKDEARTAFDERLYQVYRNNEDIHLNKLVDVEYARITARNGKVLFIDAYKFDDIAPVAKDINKDVVEYYSDITDGAIAKLPVDSYAYVIKYENDEMSLGSNTEIVKEDVIHWYYSHKDQLTVFVRPAEDNKVEGNYTEANARRANYTEANARRANRDTQINIRLDKKTDYPAFIVSEHRNPVFSTYYSEDDFQALSKAYDDDLAPFEKTDITVLRDMFGFVQLIAKETPDAGFYAIIRDVFNYDFNLLTKDNAKYKDAWYDTTKNTTFKVGGVKGTKENLLSEYQKGDLVKVDADEERVISVIDDITGAWAQLYKIDNNIVDFSNTTSKEKGKDFYYVSKNYTLFVNGVESISIADFNKKYEVVAAIADNPDTTDVDETQLATEAFVITSNRDDTVAQIIVIKNAKLKATSANDGKAVVKVTRVRPTGSEYYLTVALPDGTTSTHLVAGKQAKADVKANVIVAGDIIQATINKDADGNLTGDITTIVELIDVNDPVYKVVNYGTNARNERFVVLADAADPAVEKTLWLSKSASIFGGYSIGSYVALEKENPIDAYNVIDVIYQRTVDNDKALWAGGTSSDDELPEGAVAFKGIFTLDDNKYIQLGDKSYPFVGTQDLTGFAEGDMVIPTFTTIRGETVVTKIEAVEVAPGEDPEEPTDPEVPAIVVTVTYTPDATLGDTASTATVTVTGIENANFYRITYKLSDTETDTTDLTAIADSAPADLSVSKDVVVEIYAAADDITNGVDPLHTATVTAQLAK
jgi:hypothetical protein